MVPDFEPLTRRLVPIQWYCIQLSSHPGAQESLTAPFPYLTQAITMCHQLYHRALICGQSITPHHPDAGPHFTACLKRTTPGCFSHLSPHLSSMKNLTYSCVYTKGKVEGKDQHPSLSSNLLLLVVAQTLSHAGTTTIIIVKISFKSPKE